MAPFILPRSQPSSPSTKDRQVSLAKPSSSSPSSENVDPNIMVMASPARSPPSATKGFRSMRQRRKRTDPDVAETINIPAKDPGSDDGVCIEQRPVLVSKAEEATLKEENEASIPKSTSQSQQKKFTRISAKELNIKEKGALEEQQKIGRVTEKDQRRMEERRRLQQGKEKERLDKEEKELRTQKEEGLRSRRRRKIKDVDIVGSASVSDSVQSVSGKPGHQPNDDAITAACATINDASVSKRSVSKRKRASIINSRLDAEERSSLIKQYRSEIDSLFCFFCEGDKIEDLPNNELQSKNNTSQVSQRAEIASLIEGSSFPFSKLVTEIHGKLSNTSSGSSASMTLCSLRGNILSIGERVMFGVPNPDADVLEDDSRNCLWCWEVRDIKLFPESHRCFITANRRKHKMIGERISALSEIINILELDPDQDEGAGMEQYSVLVSKAEEALLKTEDEASIRNSVSQWQQKKCTKIAAKEVKTKQKEALKEQQKIARETVKEQRRLEKEEERRRVQQEKERERLEKEVIRRTQREQKELRRQQEESEKESKFKEAEMKKQLVLQKQASLMDRFLHSSKKESVDYVSSSTQDASAGRNEPQETHNDGKRDELIVKIDHELLNNTQSVESLFSSHKETWRAMPLSKKLKKRWGERRLPKSPSPVNFTQTSSGSKRSRKEFEEENGWPSADRTDDEWCEPAEHQCQQKPLLFLRKRRKLLQFDKSYRPAYYGSFSKFSEVVRPRNPLSMDPMLDYENDSDEEWEEEDPGESLSDCDKDDDEEKGDLDEDDGVADGFVVPDGYLSESEGAHCNDSDYGSDEEYCSSDKATDKACLPISLPGLEAEQGMSKFARQRKALQHLTDQGLKCNRPYIISNFHVKPSNVTLRPIDRLCLEALKRCPLNEVPIDMPSESQSEKTHDPEENLKPEKLKSKNVLTDSTIRRMAEAIMSSPHGHGLKRLVIAFSTKFPDVSRSQLKSKIKEIADYVDNHWQVKNEVAEQLGLTLPSAQAISSVPVTPMVKKSTSMGLKPITKFFSKRCLPPEKAGLEDPSPQKSNGKEIYGNEITILNG